MNNLNSSKLLALVKDKKKLLEEMLLLSKQQTEVIKSENFDVLEDILNRKDLIIKRIDSINLELQDFNLESQIEENISDLLSKINMILKEIKSLDDLNNKILSESMDHMKKDIKQVRQSVKAMQNYGNSDPYQAFASQGGTLFIDQDS